MPRFTLIGEITCLFLAAGLHVDAQNLVSNPSFEVHDWCPPGDNSSPGPPYPCPPWQNGNGGNIDYFHPCGDVDYQVPQNIVGYEPAHTGDAYGGLFVYLYFSNAREYFQAPLQTPLVAGTTYYVEFYVSRPESYCAVNHIGAYFSDVPPSYSGFECINVIPQIDYVQGFIYERNGWQKISGCFEAEGGESFITIGNFYTNANTSLDSCYGAPNYAYMYLDDVSVMEGDPAEVLDINLDSPVQSCYSYTIDPELSGVSYTWGDGSHEPTLTVSESGTYSLTVTNGCNVGMATVDVEIIGAPPVDIPLEQTTLCEGETLQLELDPQWDYEWSDGSTGSGLTITQGGMYSVTMDDGCMTTADTILVEGASLPAFTLGPDVQLCPGEVISFNFDESLGDFEWQDGSSSPEYEIVQGGEYDLVITNVCGSQEDDVTVTDLPQPTVSLGSNITICEGMPYVISLDPVFEYIWQDGSNDATYTITAGGNYSVTASNACGSDSDQLSVNEIQPPGVSLGSDFMLCAFQLPYTLTAQYYGASGIEWQDHSTADTLVVLAEGNYSTTVTNECFSVSDTVSIDVLNSTLHVELPPDDQICAGDSILLTNTGDPGVYLWQDHSQEDSLWVHAGGTYSLLVTSMCGSGSDTVEIVEIPLLANPDLGPDLSLCPGEQFTLFAGVTGVDYVWQDMSTADSLMITGPGTYSLMISNGCSQAFDTVIVSVSNNPPVIQLPSGLNLCQGDTLQLEPGVSGVSYVWNDGSQASSIEVTLPGSYSLTVSNACGTDIDTVSVADAGPSPTVDIPADLSICPGDLVGLNPISSNVQTWLWQDGSGQPTFEVSQPGLVIVEVYNGCGSDSDSSLVVLLPPAPVLDLGPDTSVCPGETITFSITTLGVQILWPDGSSGTSYTVSDDEMVHAEISNQCGLAEDNVAVSLLEGLPLLDLGPDQPLCPGETIHLSPGLTGVSYQWTGGSTIYFIDVTQPGMITLTVSNACGSDTDSLLIYEDTHGPDLDMGPDILGCSGDTVLLEPFIGGVDYLWHDGSTEPELLVHQSGVYVLQVSNACGTDVDSIHVDLDTKVPVPYLGADTTLCVGEILELISNAGSGTAILWQEGSSTPSFTVTGAGQYILTESNFCGSASDTIAVGFDALPPDVDLGPDTVLCPGETLWLEVPITSASVLWQDGSTGSALLADKAQQFVVTLSNQCGQVFDTVMIGYDLNLPVLDWVPSQSLCPGEEIVLDATQTFDASYLWNDGSILPVMQISAPGNYSVQVNSICGEVKEEVEVSLDADCSSDVYFPNLFSPNGDGVNDVWTVSGAADLTVHRIDSRVYDRWGSEVFSQTTWPIAWDGRSHGDLLNPGVYVYRVALQYLAGNAVVTRYFTGDVTIVR